MNWKQETTQAHPELKLILAGLGGQGVVFTTRWVAQTAAVVGLSVIASEVHGMSQRGGSVVSHLKIGGSEAPLVRRGTADVLLALELDEALSNLAFLRRGGLAFLNTKDGLQPEVMEHLRRLRIQPLSVPASCMAASLGSTRVANTVLVGFSAAHPILPLPIADLRQNLTILANRNRELNLQALEAGYQAGLQQSQSWLQASAPVSEI